VPAHGIRMMKFLRGTVMFATPRNFQRFTRLLVPLLCHLEGASPGSSLLSSRLDCSILYLSAVPAELLLPKSFCGTLFLLPGPPGLARPLWVCP